MDQSVILDKDCTATGKSHGAKYIIILILSLLTFLQTALPGLIEDARALVSELLQPIS